jgi:hypothetical protein
MSDAQEQKRTPRVKFKELAPWQIVLVISLVFFVSSSFFVLYRDGISTTFKTGITAGLGALWVGIWIARWYRLSFRIVRATRRLTWSSWGIAFVSAVLSACGCVALYAGAQMRLMRLVCSPQTQTLVSVKGMSAKFGGEESFTWNCSQEMWLNYASLSAVCPPQYVCPPSSLLIKNFESARPKGQLLLEPQELVHCSWQMLSPQPPDGVAILVTITASSRTTLESARLRTDNKTFRVSSSSLSTPKDKAVHLSIHQGIAERQIRFIPAYEEDDTVSESNQAVSLSFKAHLPSEAVPIWWTLPLCRDCGVVEQLFVNDWASIADRGVQTAAVVKDLDVLKELSARDYA